MMAAQLNFKYIYKNNLIQRSNRLPMLILIEKIQYKRPEPLKVSQYAVLMCSYPGNQSFLIILSSPLGSGVSIQSS